MDYSTSLDLGTRLGHRKGKYVNRKNKVYTGKSKCETLLKKEVNYIPQLRLEEEKSKCYSVVSQAKLTSWGTLGHLSKY